MTHASAPLAAATWADFDFDSTITDSCADYDFIVEYVKTELETA